jgi:hypothetical protein
VEGHRVSIKRGESAETGVIEEPGDRIGDGTHEDMTGHTHMEAGCLAGKEPGDGTEEVDIEMGYAVPGIKGQDQTCREDLAGNGNGFNQGNVSSFTCERKQGSVTKVEANDDNQCWAEPSHPGHVL